MAVFFHFRTQNLRPQIFGPIQGPNFAFPLFPNTNVNKYCAVDWESGTPRFYSGPDTDLLHCFELPLNPDVPQFPHLLSGVNSNNLPFR